MGDNVNNPSHYMFQQPCKEAIEVIRDRLTEEEFRGYIKGNIIKYALRAGWKDDEAEDLAKIKKYVEFFKL